MEWQAAHSAQLKDLSSLALLEDESNLCEVPKICRMVAAHQLFDTSGHNLNETDADGPDAILSFFAFLDT